MPISIPSDTTSKEQLLQARAFITQNAVTWCLGSLTRCFLPLPYIKELATHANIKAFCDQDMGLRKERLPANSRDFFINKVFKHGQRCFVATLLANGNMLFLWNLMNRYDDVDLPIGKDLAIADEFQAGLDAFLKFQDWVLVPVLRLGEYDQQIPSFGSLPLISITARDDPDAYDVEFSSGHLTSSDSATPGARYAGRTKFVLTAFKDRINVENHGAWGQRRLGIVCKDKYFLCSSQGS